MAKQSEFKQKINLYVSRLTIGLTLLSCLILFIMVLSKPSHGKISSAQGSAKVILAETSQETPLVAPESFVEVANTQELLALFEQHDYALDFAAADEIANENPIEVPALFLATLPNDFAKNMTTQDKKVLFIRTLLPLILDANIEIEAERTELMAIKKDIDEDNELSADQMSRLQELAEKYRIKNFGMTKFEKLLKKVDVIPVAMALGQAIEETGWGRSYAARIKNATHGVTLSSGVKAYASLQESVKSYMRNLNANPAYKKMRDIRACLRLENKDLCGIKLMDGLYHYSELHHAYIKKVKEHIRRHNLAKFEDYQLKEASEAQSKA